MQAGGAVFCNERRLDGYGSAAAERVTEILPAAIARKAYHGRGHRLLQGRRVMRRAVAALVQTLTGGVDTKRRDVLHYRKLYLILLRRFGKPLNSVNALEALDYRLLYDLLAVGYRKKL